MCQYENTTDDQNSVQQMNSELQHAQLELLSAHCATHQLRLRYSSDDLARFGRRDLLRKSAEAASALSEFYSSIEKQVPQSEPDSGALQPTEDQIAQAVHWLSSYLEEQRQRYSSISGPLGARLRASMWPYFSSELLDQVRMVELLGSRVPIPDFYVQARALGFEPPEVSHMDSLTFVDVIAFNDQLTERALFHGLVHAVQIQVLGLQRYAELWVRSFIRTRVHFTVPLEVHAFSLASRYVRPVPERFSVEDHVRRWVEQDRY